jgi:hypothetical protein
MIHGGMGCVIGETRQLGRGYHPSDMVVLLLLSFDRWAVGFAWFRGLRLGTL